MTFWEWLTEPKYTKLEQELARRITYLELELSKERDRFKEFAERIAFPEPYNTPTQGPTGPFQSVPAPNKTQAEAQRLSQLSRQRLEEQIAEMEKRAASISSRDESLSAKANDETKEEEAEEA